MAPATYCISYYGTVCPVPYFFIELETPFPNYPNPMLAAMNKSVTNGNSIMILPSPTDSVG